MYSLSEILDSIQPVRKQIVIPSLLIDTLSYDSRKIRDGEHSIFFALKDQRDGHHYIADAYHKGVKTFVLTDLSFDISSFAEANFVWVEDALEALQQIASFHRKHIRYPVIAITGSNGKTIVKEWLTQMLRKDNHIYQSPKSYNSQLGVALSVWGLPNQADLAIIEAGISMVGEMARLERIIQPSWGIFTGLGTAHREGFDSKEQKLEEKWKLFRNAIKVISAPINALVDFREPEKSPSWGYRDKDKLQIIDIKINNSQSDIRLRYQDDFFVLSVPFKDKASLDNMLTCTLVLLEMGYDKEEIQRRLMELKPLEMRLQLKKGKNNSSIIDDSYSNDLASLEIALHFLSQQNQYSKKKLILSDFEGERWTPKFLEKLQKLLSLGSLQEIIFIGSRLDNIFVSSDTQRTVYPDTDTLLQNIGKHDFSESVILIKGARKYRLERLSKLLTEKSHETVLQINLNALEHNLKQYRSKLAPHVKLMVMVKAFSYGSGSFEIANMLQFNNVDYLTVAFADEGAELRRAGVQLPIMVLSPHESAFEDIVWYKLEPEIYSVRVLKAFIAYLQAKGLTDYPVHIKLDTGMHRVGFMEHEVDEMLEILLRQSRVKVRSAFSHLVGAGDPQLLAFTQQQISLYQRLVKKIEKHIGYSFIRHICNTSGIVHHPEAHMDMVRLGIGLYGYDMTSTALDLQEVGRLKTTITQIKRLPMTETVGYDRKGRLRKDSVIATVKIGYADGYSRRFGNGVGEMMVNGHVVRTVGNICMDMCMLDISDIDATEGDEVIVFPDLAKAANDIGTIPYELLTGISSRVKRVYYYE